MNTRPSPGSSRSAAFGRRTFLGGLAAAGALALTGCAAESTRLSPHHYGAGGVVSGDVAYPLARQSEPVTWSDRLGQERVVSGQRVPRGGRLQIYTWSSYLSDAVVNDFAKRYDASVTVSTFDSMQEGMTKLATGKIRPDLFTPQINTIGQCVAGGLIRPLNHDYIPNIAGVWDYFHDPFYDRHARYSVPYTCTVTGVIYRRDVISDADMQRPDAGYSVFWRPDLKGKVGILDDYREGLGMAMLRRGEHDLNTSDRSTIARAGADLVELNKTNNIRIDAAGGVNGIPTGQFVAYQAQSGDPLQAVSLSSDPSQIGFWYPKNRAGTAGNDMWSIGSRGENPLLAHAFLDYLLEPENALRNYDAIGYQPPIDIATPTYLTTHKKSNGQPYVPTWLADCIVRPVDFEYGEPYCELAPSVDNAYLGAWQKVKTA